MTMSGTVCTRVSIGCILAFFLSTALPAAEEEKKPALGKCAFFRVDARAEKKSLEFSPDRGKTWEPCKLADPCGRTFVLLALLEHDGGAVCLAHDRTLENPTQFHAFCWNPEKQAWAYADLAVESGEGGSLAWGPSPLRRDWMICFHGKNGPDHRLSRDGGKTWKAVDEAAARKHIADHAQTPADLKKIHDDYESLALAWAARQRESECNVADVYLNPLDEKEAHVWILRSTASYRPPQKVGGDTPRLLYTADAGKTFREINPDASSENPAYVEVENFWSFKDGVLSALVSRSETSVSVSFDGGKSWGARVDAQALPWRFFTSGGVRWLKLWGMRYP